MPPLKLIRKAHIFAPEDIGIQDILIAGGKIIALEKEIKIETSVEVEVVEAKGKLLVPGFIDGHVHIIGGGGEGGYQTRTPEIQLTDISTAGVTTVVGCLGTDGSSRSMQNLVAKTMALRAEGLNAWCFTGSYEIPLRTLTGSVRDDLIFIEPVIGVGEVAISDHRSSQPDVQVLKQLAADAHVAGMLSGKAGIINLHIGSGRGRLEIIENILDHSALPIDVFWPTHVNRDAQLFQAAIAFAKRGGTVDLTTGIPSFIGSRTDGSAADALAKMLQAGVAVQHITFTSDGQGSLPEFDESGHLTGLRVGQVNTQLIEFQKAVTRLNIPVQSALQPLTNNPARVLGLTQKGHIQAGMDADLLLLDGELGLRDVMANGRWLVREEVPLVKGTFEL